MAEPNLTFRYIGQRFQQRNSANQQLLLFVAPAGEIQKWAGVARKTFDFQHGFQRTLSRSRISEISRYFRHDGSNISPTSILVGFTDHQSNLTIESVVADHSEYSDLVRVTISVPDYDKQPLSSLIHDAITYLETRLPLEITQQAQASVAAAVAGALELEEDRAVDEEFGLVTDDEEEPSDLSQTGDDLSRPDQSYLPEFYSELLGYSHNLTHVPDDSDLRQVLYSLLMPGLIVDGQHRVFGAAAADETIRLAVCGLQDSTWSENVYQFVIINQKAKPIRPAFLNAIIATSLTDVEIDVIYERFRLSNVDVGRAEIMDAINSDDRSPFKQMIDFELAGSQGFLAFPGMSRLAKDFQSIPRSHAVLLSGGIWNETTGEWLSHFYALWTGVRDYFVSMEEGLWQESSEQNVNNLLMIVSLQEIQRIMLNTWSDSKTVTFRDPADTTALAMRFWEGFPASFFTDEWKKKSLQTSVGRDIIRRAIIETRRSVGRRGFSHRRLSLFRE